MIKFMVFVVVFFVLIKKVGIFMGICFGGLCDLIMIVVVINVIKIMISGMLFFIKMEFFIYYF